MPGTSVPLLDETSLILTKVGKKVRGDGWYGYSDGKHTVAIHTSNFSGRIYIEGSLADEPGDNDWFAIPLDSNNPTQGYVEFSHPFTLGIGRSSPDFVVSYNFSGKFTWVRARLDRTYIFQTATQDQLKTLGSILGIWMAN